MDKKGQTYLENVINIVFFIDGSVTNFYAGNVSNQGPILTFILQTLFLQKRTAKNEALGSPKFSNDLEMLAFLDPSIEIRDLVVHLYEAPSNLEEFPIKRAASFGIGRPPSGKYSRPSHSFIIMKLRFLKWLTDPSFEDEESDLLLQLQWLSKTILPNLACPQILESQAMGNKNLRKNFLHKTQNPRILNNAYLEYSNPLVRGAVRGVAKIHTSYSH
ncbi:hypothetical protein M9H77_24567 [Catharanthus roseus]|uniref:Uncharacterized protein n=1 Tax=Catharanthus roseus TaxID=4058 RepID=A0ACC0AWI7_CATRO|nr:hypothetical protein M9H77_24567 [Catharanthus roseus]